MSALWLTKFAILFCQSSFYTVTCLALTFPSTPHGTLLMALLQHSPYFALYYSYIFTYSTIKCYDHRGNTAPFFLYNYPSA